MEHVREFSVIVCMDSNKRTSRQLFDLEDYDSYSDLIEEAITFLRRIDDEGVTEVMPSQLR